MSDDEIAAIVSRERMELAEALGRYRELGPSEELADLEEQMAIVDRYA